MARTSDVPVPRLTLADQPGTGAPVVGSSAARPVVATPLTFVNSPPTNSLPSAVTARSSTPAPLITGLKVGIHSPVSVERGEVRLRERRRRRTVLDLEELAADVDGVADLGERRGRTAVGDRGADVDAGDLPRQVDRLRSSIGRDRLRRERPCRAASERRDVGLA